MITSGGIISGGILSGGIRSGGVGAEFGGLRGFGAYLNFLTSVFRTTVPQASSRTFLETHVYTGSPKLTLQSTGYLGWNRHNLIKFSNQQANTAGYTPSGTTATGAQTSWDGSTNATLLKGTAASAQHYIGTQTNYSISAPTNTHSWYVKAFGAQQYIALAAGANVVCFDIVNGTVGASSNATGTITSLGSGWYRISAVGTAVVAGQFIYLALNISNSATIQSYAGDVNNGAYIVDHMVSNGSVLFDQVTSFATVPRLDAPYYWDTSGTRQGILVEPAATNSCLWSDDMTNAAWVSSSITAAKTATGADGIANSATTLTATGANGTCLQTFVSASATRQYGAYIKRRTGTGNIQMTVDNGATWTTVTATSSFTLVSINQAAVTNPVIGFRIVTSGDAIDVQYNQLENAGTVTTSPIPTTTIAIPRTADTMYRVLGPEWSGYTAGTAYVRAARMAPAPGSQNYLLAIVSGARFFYFNGTADNITTYDGTTVKSTGNNTTQAVFFSAGQSYGALGLRIKLDAGSIATGAFDGTFGTSADTLLGIGSIGSGGAALTAFQVSKIKYWAIQLADADLTTAVENGTNPSTPQLDFDYANATYTITPVNAGVTTTYTAATLVTSGKLTQTGPSAVWLRNSAGLLASVDPTQTALIEYAADGSVLGFIGDEPARTNSVLQSQTFNTTWSISNIAAFGSGSVINDGVAPDGTTTADLIRDTNVGGGPLNCTINQNVTTTAAPWTFSVFLKRPTASAARYINLYNAAVNKGWAFDILNGVIGVGGTTAVGAPTTYKIEQYANGWYRCQITLTATAASNNWRIYLLDNDGSGISSYVTDGRGIYVWGAQVEAGDYASSYIPTTGSTQLRAAIVSTLNLGSEFDNSRSIVASKAYAGRANMTDGSVTPAVWSLNKATPVDTDYEVIYLTSTNQINYLDRVSTSGSAVDGAAGVATSLSYPATIRTAFGYSPSNVFLSLNGATQAVTGTPSAIQASYTLLRLGTSPRTNVTQGSVYIQNLTIAPTVPTQTNVNAAASVT